MVFYRIYATILFALISGLAYGQSPIKGKVIDENFNPIEFATVSVFTLPDSMLIGGGITNSQGQFEIKLDIKSNFYLRISYVGYQTATVYDVNQNTITLHPAASQIGEVKVMASRPKIQFKGDRYEIDIENSMIAHGNKMDDLLQQLPGVQTNGGSITVNGQIAQVIVDNKTLKISDDAIMSYLQTLRSEDISTVEIIPNPSAIYDAEGGSIVRIITKKKKEQGFDLTISDRTTFQNFFGNMPYLQLQYNRNKFTSAISMNAERSKWLIRSKHHSVDNNHNIEYLTPESNDTVNDKNYSANIDLGYDFNSRNSVKLNGSYMLWSKDEKMNFNTDIIGATNKISQTKTTQHDNQAMQSYSFTLNYDHAFDSLKNKTLLIMADYIHQFSYPYNSILGYYNTDVNNVLVAEENYKYEQNKPYQIISSEVRYTHVTNKIGTFKTGIKYSNVSISNALQCFELDNAVQWVQNPLMGYDMKYDEQITAAYLSYNINKGKWSAGAGLRGEYTLPYRDKNKGYGNLFPSANITFRPHEAHSIGVNYSKRISRVPYYQMQPSRYYVSRYEMMEGNPKMQPNIIHKLGLNYSFNNKYYLSISYSLNTNDRTGYLRNELLDSTLVFVQTYTDGVDGNYITANAYVPIKFFDWWSSINQFNLYHNRYGIYDELINTSTTYDIYTRHTFSLPKEILLELQYRYISPYTDVYKCTSATHSLSVGMKRYFLNQSLLVKFDVSRIIQHRSGYELNMPTTRTVYEKIPTGPLFALTVSYYFSRGVSREIWTQSSSQDEQNRTY